ncbi:MAG: low molecular weight protein arginine phosphatase [Acetivibrio ethanolgignens]
MSKYQKVIFVCTGNTCRSPMAEVLFKSLQSDNSIQVLSRGLVVLFPEPSNPKAETVLKSHNLILENHTATPLMAEDIDDHTLVLAMTQAQKNNIIKDFGHQENVFTLKGFVGEEGDVTDPYGGDLIDYENCFAQLARLVKKTVIKINELD